MRLLAALLAASAFSVGCAPVLKLAAPSNVRNWEPDHAKLASAEIQGDRLTIRNVRNCRYFDENTFVADYEDRQYRLQDLRHVDFLVAPFNGMPMIAHTMLSFEFQPPDGPPQYLACSIETRKEKGETYSFWKGSARQYELIYVLADERDVIQLRTNHRGESVYLYRSRATPEQARTLLVDVLHRVNELEGRPEFYGTFTNNCTTNLMAHVNRIDTDFSIRYDYRVLLPGYTDRLAYDEGLIESRGTFAETRAAAFVNARAVAAADRPDFSQVIRR